MPHHRSPRRPHSTRPIYDDEAVIEGVIASIEEHFSFDINEGICKTPKRRVQ